MERNKVEIYNGLRSYSSKIKEATLNTKINIVDTKHHFIVPWELIDNNDTTTNNKIK